MPRAPHAPPSPNTPESQAYQHSDGCDPEKNPMPPRAPFFSRRNLLGPVVKDYGDYPLLACSFVTGMVDGACFRNFGMFVGMQTGNTVILGLSTAGLPQSPWAWLTTLVSLASFLLGALSTFRLSRRLAPAGPTQTRVWAAALFLIQAAFLLLAAALATPANWIPQQPAGTSRTTPDDPGVIRDVLIVAIIPPMAVQAGVQIATSRLLGFNELPVNVLTSTYCDLMGDAQLFARDNMRRDRRAASAVLLLAGAMAAGWLLRSSAGLRGLLWLGAGIKVVAGLAYFALVPAVEEAREGKTVE